MCMAGWAWPEVKPRRGKENEQTIDTGGNLTQPAKLHKISSNLGEGHLGWGRVRPMSPAEHSRRSRARERDDDIVRLRSSRWHAQRTTRWCSTAPVIFCRSYSNG